jgi:hypothetical protein
MLRWDTGGGALGIFVLIIAGIVLLAQLPTIIDSVGGILWWVFGK